MARRAADDVRPWSTCRGWCASTARAGPARPGAHRGQGCAERALPTRAWRAVVHRGLCLYRDGRDSVAWHGDTIGRGSTEDTVVIVSLGTPRALLLRPRDGGGPVLRHDVGHGDLLVMGGSCQRTWEHGVPKSTRVTGPRISVQFRPTACADGRPGAARGRAATGVPGLLSNGGSHDGQDGAQDAQRAADPDPLPGRSLTIRMPSRMDSSATWRPATGALVGQQDQQVRGDRADPDPRPARAAARSRSGSSRRHRAGSRPGRR